MEQKSGCWHSNCPNIPLGISLSGERRGVARGVMLCERSVVIGGAERGYRSNVMLCERSMVIVSL